MNCGALTVLSPHRDDAVFSLGLSLQRWAQAGVRIRVANFFTISNYAPHVADQSASHVSGVRAREDRRALIRVSRSITVRDEELQDAPLRLGIDWRTVCQTGGRLQTRDEVQMIVPLLKKFSTELLVAPLGLGDHIDHLIVREAALEAARSRTQVGFYEDLPYATWTPEDAVRAKVAEASAGLGVPLRPSVRRTPRAVNGKRRLAASYSSQIGADEADVIAQHARRYGGERIWIPQHAPCWLRLR